MAVPACLLKLLSKSKKKSHLVQGWSAQSIGRNNVWKLDSPEHAVFFAKFPARDTLDREIVGLNLAIDLAGRDARFMAAPIETIDEDIPCIVTRAIGGTSLAELFKYAYRWDKNPLRRAAPIARVHRALSLALDWIAAWQQQQLEHLPLFEDHSPRGMYARIVVSWDADLGIPPVEFGFLQDKSDDYQTLLFGDASLGNFFYDDHRIGAIDFENIGFGNPHYDLLILRHWIHQAFGQWGYSCEPSLVTQIPESEHKLTSILAGLERSVLDHEFATERSDKRKQAQARSKVVRYLQLTLEYDRVLSSPS